MIIEPLSISNLSNLVDLVLELWPECLFDEEYAYFEKVLSSEDEACYLVKEQESYMAFTHVTIRKDYVEGATALPIAYLEAVYVKPAYHRLGVGKRLVDAAAHWGRQKGCGQLASDTELHNLNSIEFHKSSGFTEVNRIVCFVKKI